MEFQSQPNRWSCSVTAAAMVMGVPVQDLIARIGHDGGEVVFPDLTEPACRAGFDMQEITDAALDFGWSVTPIEANPQCTPDGENIRDVFPEDKIKERMDAYFKKYSGTVTGQRINGKYWHHVAWDHKKQLWLDPSGPILPFEKVPIKIAYFHIFVKNEQLLAKTFLQSLLTPYRVTKSPYDPRPLQDLGPKRFS